MFNPESAEHQKLARIYGELKLGFICDSYRLKPGDLTEPPEPKVASKVSKTIISLGSNYPGPVVWNMQREAANVVTEFWALEQMARQSVDEATAELAADAIDAPNNPLVSGRAHSISDFERDLLALGIDEAQVDAYTMAGCEVLDNRIEKEVNDDC